MADTYALGQGTGPLKGIKVVEIEFPHEHLIQDGAEHGQIAGGDPAEQLHDPM